MSTEERKSKQIYKLQEGGCLPFVQVKFTNSAKLNYLKIATKSQDDNG
jgi:hypothetical protein